MTGESNIDVPPFDGSPRSLMMVKRAAKSLQASLSLSRQADQFGEWAVRNAARLKARSFSLNKQRWTSFVNRPVDYVTDEPDLPRLAWNWFFEVHHHAIEELWLTMPHASPTIPNSLVPTLHAFLSPNVPSPNVELLTILEGDYAAYRLSFLNPQKVMVMSMRCGVDNDISRFTIKMSFHNEDAEPMDEHVEGYALPYQDSILFQGRLIETASPFIFTLFGFPLHLKSGKISESSGALLVGSKGTLSSAYPIIIRRVENPVTPCVYDFDTFKKAVPAHKSILRVMERGMVGWR